MLSTCPGALGVMVLALSPRALKPELSFPLPTHRRGQQEGPPSHRDVRKAAIGVTGVVQAGSTTRAVIGGPLLDSPLRSLPPLAPSPLSLPPLAPSPLSLPPPSRSSLLCLFLNPRRRALPLRAKSSTATTSCTIWTLSSTLGSSLDSVEEVRDRRPLDSVEEVRDRRPLDSVEEMRERRPLDSVEEGEGCCGRQGVDSWVYVTALQQHLSRAGARTCQEPRLSSAVPSSRSSCSSCSS
uniref:Uncharacterized protein n=1 Tax=Knipowitschia caucasica TaxID=637954 RepID=A0AAV2JI30_KNICA